MKLEYRNGNRITKLVHEMDPLEAAINQYEFIAKNKIDRYKQLASEHYAKESTLTEAERAVEKKEAMKFLNLEWAKLEVIADVQGQLSNYRKSALRAVTGTRKERDAGIRKLRNEEHHPTDTLEKFMLAEGKPKPSSKHTAHHIVPGKGKDEVVTARARLHLHRHGIGINDPANGVYLLHKDEYAPHWSMPRSRGHLKYHTLAYESWVLNRIRARKNIDSIKTELQVVGRLLQSNEPKNIPGIVK
jgi:hypothetical protein